jgi:methyl-accepting chemotaxis protein
MPSSSLRTILIVHVGIGLAIGLALPFLINPFVLWQPGTHAGFSLAAAVAGAAIGLLNYWIVHQQLAEPLEAIAEVATAIGNGDLSRRCGSEGGDSLGAIAQAINQMATTLRKLIDDLSALGNEVDGGSRSIQHAFGDVRERFALQQAETAHIVGILEEMRGKGGEVVATAGQVTDSTLRAVEVARDGTSVVDETIRGMGVIEHTVSRASDEVFQLGQRSDEIGAIIEVIRGIAEQTNLLALNAAIEAARAGEQGRGFAVVADEVRKLAEKTGSATEEISQMISGIQAQVKQTVVTMGESRENVQIGVTRAETAGRSLGEMLESVQGISSLMARITALADEQQTLIGDIAGRASGIAGSIDATLEQALAGDQSCLDLAARSSSLQDRIGRFRVA